MSAAANRPVLTIRGVELGVGRPKVIVPLTDAHDSSLIASAKRIAASRTDMVEWRVDRYASRDDHTKVVAMAARIHEIIGERPLLFTPRTKHEGSDWICWATAIATSSPMPARPALSTWSTCSI